jgi:hypothetical protein
MRTANWDVVRLAKLITKGMTVEIEGPPPVPRPAPAIAEETLPAAEPPPEQPKRKFSLFFWKR